MTEQLTMELEACEATLLREIANSRLYQRDIAKTYALAMASSECDTVDWRKVNLAIMNRWSARGLEHIKEMAWSVNGWTLGT